jgi:hypothetical protein
MTAYSTTSQRRPLVLDCVPAKVYAGENEGSLAERWLEQGNSILWSGYTPFYEYVSESGTTSSVGAGFYGADEIFDSGFAFIEYGAGYQHLKPAAALLPSLAPYSATRALRYNQLHDNWKVDVLYAEDDDQDSDAIAIRHTSGGNFAQFYCTASAVPRQQVLIQYLKTRYFYAAPRLKH